ncbi:MAG: hypothetical protein JSR77_07835 [Planctomycetes bacterium]|nr:hypothetical protein [Planctomycetota bacterium]
MNRNLTWKLSRVMTAQAPFAALNHLPGQQGLDLALAAMGKAGAPQQLLDAVRNAMKNFVEVAQRHVGDRDHLELALESMGLFERESRLETGRELAYRGNSMIWGVQARTRFAVTVVGPDGEGAMGFAQVAGLIGFRRLRPTARWRLARRQVQDDSGKEMANIGLEEIEARGPGDTPFIVKEFCSPGVPQIEMVPGPEGLEYILPGGPVGNQGAFDVFFGFIARGLPMYRDNTNMFGSSGTSITLPAETLLCDLIIHRGVPMPHKPEFLTYGFPHGGADGPGSQTVQNELPINQDIIELAGSPPAVATPLVPNYRQLIARIYERMGWTPSEFRGYRVQMPFPAMSSRVVVRWPLPEAPGKNGHLPAAASLAAKGLIDGR